MVCLRWRHLVNAYEVTAAGGGWCDCLAPFVLAAYARAKPCCCCPAWQYMSCHCCPAWQAVVVIIVGWAVCLNLNKRRLLLLLLLLLVSILIGIFHIGKFCYWVPFFKKLLLRNYVVDFVEICNVCARKAIIEAAKRIINFDKVCHSYSDLNFGVTFLGTQCIFYLPIFYLPTPCSPNAIAVCQFAN